MGRAIAFAGLIIGLFGLVVQCIVSIQTSASIGRSLPASIEYFLSFFTVMTNIAVVLVYLAALVGRPGWFLLPIVRSGVAVSIVVVSITYAVILARLWAPTGWSYVADATLHYAAPALYVAWWLGYGRTGSSRLTDIPVWLVYPVSYLVFVLVRGSLIGLYPYPFLDLTTRTAGQVTSAVLSMVALFAATALCAVALDRLLPAPRPIQD